MKVIQVPALQDNYCYLIVCQQTNTCAVLDPADGPPILKSLTEHTLSPNMVLVTHHHSDHVDGINLLVQNVSKDLPVYGSQYDFNKKRIPHQSHPLKEGDRLKVGTLEFSILETPGHTLGHITYVTKGAIFCGDTLFASGCGRLFEGDAEMMLASLKKLKQLPDDTKVYCAHEYTQINLAFAMTLEPNNRDLQRKAKEVDALRKKGKPSVPTTLKEEKSYNPFLRWDSQELISSVKDKFPDIGSSELEIFAATRQLKDRF